MIEEGNEWLSFPHKIIHEYIAACYLLRRISEEPQILPSLFPTWRDLKRHEEVYNFCIGCSSGAKMVGYSDLLVGYFCSAFSYSIIENVKNCSDAICHSGIYKIDIIVNKVEESGGFRDKAELLQVFSAMCREARAHGNTILYNPVCNKYIHIYPECTNTDPAHVSRSKLVVFTENIQPAHQAPCVSFNSTNRDARIENCIVIFGSKKSTQDLGSINLAVSNCNVAQVYITDCFLEKSNGKNVNNIFTQSIVALLIKNSSLSALLWNEIGNGVKGSKGMNYFALRFCTGVSEHLLTHIATLTTLTWLEVLECKLSNELCELLCRQVIHLPHLESLVLQGNHIGGGSIGGSSTALQFSK